MVNSKEDNNMKEVKDEIVLWIREWFEANGDENTIAVVGISGGKDSSVVAALCTEALGRERVLGVLMPSGRQADINDSYDLVNHLAIPSVQINIGSMYREAIDLIENSIGEITNPLVKGNTQARLRMTTLYAVSQQHGGRVSNNCNASERFIGYSTVYGDDAGDFSPLSSLTSNMVMQLGKELRLPRHLWSKTPIDGLENNMVDGEAQSDEIAMGFTYEQLDEFMVTGDVKGNPAAADLIASKHKQSEFKRKLPRIPNYDGIALLNKIAELHNHVK